MAKPKFLVGDRFEYIGYNSYALGFIVILKSIDKYKSSTMFHFDGDMKIDCNEEEWVKMMKFNFKKI